MYHVYFHLKNHGQLLESSYHKRASAESCIDRILNGERRVNIVYTLEDDPEVYIYNSDTGIILFRRKVKVVCLPKSNASQVLLPIVTAETIEVLNNALSGDGLSLSRLYSMYYPFVLKHCANAFKRYSLNQPGKRGSRGIAKQPHDLATEVFLSLFRLGAEISNIHDIKSYLRRTSWNMTMRYSIHLTTRANASGFYIDDAEEVDYFEDESEDFRTVARRAMWEAIKELTPRQSELFLLYYQSKLSYAEIKERLKVSNTTVKKHLFDARERIKKALTAKGLKYAE